LNNTLSFASVLLAIVPAWPMVLIEVLSEMAALAIGQQEYADLLTLVYALLHRLFFLT
jgi:hypothetical protein